METIASGAWSALGNAWKGGNELVHRYDWLLWFYLFYNNIDLHVDCTVSLVTGHCDVDFCRYFDGNRHLQILQLACCEFF